MSQGHWRRLKPGQTGEGRYGEDTPGKTWVDTKDSPQAQKARESGKVPIPVVVKKDEESGFVVLAVPGGNFFFAVHISILPDFGKAVAEAKNWTNDEKVREVMKRGEKEGKFGIFKADKQVVGYK